MAEQQGGYSRTRPNVAAVEYLDGDDLVQRLGQTIILMRRCLMAHLSHQVLVIAIEILFSLV
jgi:hypothetical protein